MASKSAISPWETTHETLRDSLDYRGQCMLSVEVIRAALSEAFGGAPFPSLAAEPWLPGWSWPAGVSSRSPTGWNRRLGVVFEYRGRHHFESPPASSGLPPDLQRWQTAQDLLLEEHCVDSELTLLTVPYYITYTRLRDYIRHELGLLGYRVSRPEPDSAFYDRVFQRCFSAGFADERL